MRIRYKAVYSPRFGEAFSYELDEEARKRVDRCVFGLRSGELEGESNGVALEFETEAGEIMTYDLKGDTLYFLDVHVS